MRLTDPKDDEVVGRRAYERWWRECGEHVGPGTPWDELPDGIRNAWVVTVTAERENAVAAMVERGLEVLERRRTSADVG